MHATLLLGGPLQRVQLRSQHKASPLACRRMSACRCRKAAPPPQAFFNRGSSNSSSSSGPPPAQPSGGNSNSSSGGGGSAQDTMVSDGAIKSLSPEARRIFREAQDNIIELNKSRLRALEELKAARQKIAELESKLENAVAEASSATAQLQQLGPVSSQQAAQAVAAAAGQPTTGEVLTFNFGQQQQQQAPLQQQAVPPAQQQAVPPAAQQPPQAGPTITVVYETGWGAAYLHHNADGRGWTTLPGLKMDNGSQQFPDKKVVTVPGRRLEFVINDGGSDWDKPWDSKSGNYVVDEPGVYRLKNGKVARLA